MTEIAGKNIFENSKNRETNIPVSRQVKGHILSRACALTKQYKINNK